MNSAPRPWSCSSYHSYASPISRTARSETLSRCAMYPERSATELLPKEIRLRDRPRTRRDGDRAQPLTHLTLGPPPVQRRCCPRSARPGGYARQWVVQESQRLKSASCFVAYHCWSSAPTKSLYLRLQLLAVELRAPDVDVGVLQQSFSFLRLELAHDLAGRADHEHAVGEGL